MTIRFHWGTGIAMTYAAFALATMGVVVFAMGRPAALVRVDYYAESLREDQHLAAVRNARELGSRLSVAAAGDRSVVVSLPRDGAQPVRGTITLYRASDATADRKIDLSLDSDGRQRVSLAGLPAGRWLVQIQWTAGDRQYYVEQAVFAR